MDIKFLDCNMLDENNIRDIVDESYHIADSSCRDDESKSIQSFTFEAQVRGSSCKLCAFCCFLHDRMLPASFTLLGYFLPQNLCENFYFFACFLFVYILLGA